MDLAVQPAAIDGLECVYRLEGLPVRYFGDEQLPMLALNIQIELPMVCQRCLDAMPLSLDLSFEFAVCNEPSEALLDADDVDWLDPAQEMSIANLLEDELLMALPISVLHEADCELAQREVGKVVSPFAVLEQLKKR